MAPRSPDLNDIYRELGELKGSVDGLREAIVSESGVAAKTRDNARRIESLERSRAKLWGMGTVLAAVAAWIGWDDFARYFRGLS